MCGGWRETEQENEAGMPSKASELKSFGGWTSLFFFLHFFFFCDVAATVPFSESVCAISVLSILSVNWEAIDLR